MVDWLCQRSPTTKKKHLPSLIVEFLPHFEISNDGSWFKTIEKHPKKKPTAGWAPKWWPFLVCFWSKAPIHQSSKLRPSRGLGKSAGTWKGRVFNIHPCSGWGDVQYEWYWGWFRNPKQPPGMVLKPCKRMGHLPYHTGAGFLNHQQYEWYLGTKPHPKLGWFFKEIQIVIPYPYLEIMMQQLLKQKAAREGWWWNLLTCI